MKTLIFYFNANKASRFKALSKKDYLKFIRIAASQCVDEVALERATPRRGEVLLNTVTIK